ILQLFYSSEMGVNDVLSSKPLLPYRTKLISALRQQLPYFAFIRWQCVLDNGWAVSILSTNEKPRQTHSSKFIDFSHVAAAFWSTYSAKFRKGLQRKKNKAEQQGALRLVCATGANDLSIAFEQFLEVENSGWKGQGGT